MSNCLFEAAFEQILEDCKCAPGFHNEGGADAMEVGLLIKCFSRRTSFKSSKFPFNHIRIPDMLAYSDVRGVHGSAAGLLQRDSKQDGTIQ